MKIESMSSKQAREHGQKNEARLAEVKQRIGEIAPPPKPRGSTGPASLGAPRYDPLAKAGPEYRTIALEGTPAQLVKLVAEHEELKAELTMLEYRRDELKHRAKVAGEEEAKAEAPANAKKHAAALPKAASKVLALRKQFGEAREAMESELRGLKSARALTEDTGPALTLDDWLLVESAARLRIDDSRPTALRAFNAAGMYQGEAGQTITHPSLDLGLLGEPDAPSLWPRWLRARESMSPRERASSMVPHSEEDVRRVARELARKALVQNPPDKKAFHNAWSAAEAVVEEQKEKDAANAQRREAAARSKAKGESWIDARRRNQVAK